RRPGRPPDPAPRARPGGDRRSAPAAPASRPRAAPRVHRPEGPPLAAAPGDARLTGPSAAAADAGPLAAAWVPNPTRDPRPRAAALVTLCLTWEAVGRLARFPFLHPLSSVLAALWQLTVDGEILGSLARSLASLLVGYALASALGLAIGALMARHDALDSLL